MRKKKVESGFRKTLQYFYYEIVKCLWHSLLIYHYHTPKAMEKHKNTKKGKMLWLPPNKLYDHKRFT